MYGLPDRTDPHDDVGLIAYAIRFAEGRETAAPPMRPEAIQCEVALSGRAPGDTGWSAFSQVTDEQRAAERARLMRLLEEVLSLATGSAHEQEHKLIGMYHRVRNDARKVKWEHAPVRAPDGSFGWRHQAIADSPDAFYVLLVSVLVEHRADLRRCMRCGRFFLSHTKYVVKYCPDGCGSAEHEARSAERQRRARARKFLEGRWGRKRASAAVKRASKEHPEAKTVKEVVEYARELLKAPRRDHQ